MHREANPRPWIFRETSLSPSIVNAVFESQAIFFATSEAAVVHPRQCLVLRQTDVLRMQTTRADAHTAMRVADVISLCGLVDRRSSRLWGRVEQASAGGSAR